MYKILFSVCMAAFACASALSSPLHAAEGKPVNLKKLKALLPELKQFAAQEPKQAKVRYVNDVLEHVEYVVEHADYLTAEDLQAAVEGVKKAQEALKHRGHWSSSSSSSSSKCHACDELDELDSDIQNCCNQVLELLYEVEELLDMEYPCDPPIAISEVPFVITEAGKYCVTQSLTYNGSEAAITVAADNVTINFHNNSLMLNDPDADGIYVEGQREFTLLNDRIEGPGLTDIATGSAIHLVDVQKAHIDNVYTYNTVKGINLYGCQDVRIENSLLSSHRGIFYEDENVGSAIWIDASVGVLMDNLVLDGANVEPVEEEFAAGLAIFGESANISIKNSVITNWSEAIYAAQVTGLIVDSCTAVASPYTDLCLVQLGDYYDPAFAANDVIMRNSTFEQPAEVSGFDGILLLQGSGAIFENLIVDVITIPVEDYTAAAIHVGCGSINGCQEPIIPYSNLYARDCIVKGSNFFGLLLEAAEDITFSHSQFVGSYINVLFATDAEHCQVLDSLLTYGETGVYMDDGSRENAVVNCQITENYHGITVAEFAESSQIKGNRIFGNLIYGIENYSTNASIFFNTSCNNGTNCFGAFPTQPPGGFPVLAGANVCCFDNP